MMTYLKNHSYVGTIIRSWAELCRNCVCNMHWDPLAGWWWCMLPESQVGAEDRKGRGGGFTLEIYSLGVR